MLKRNILFVTVFPLSEASIQNYTLPHLLKIKKILHPNSQLVLSTLEVFKDPNVKELKKKIEDLGIKVLDLPYAKGGVNSYVTWGKNLILLLRVLRKYKIDTIHGWCMQGGAISSILAKLTGKRLILDSCEPHAESMVENGSWERNGMKFKLLFYLEKFQVSKADHVVGVATGMDDYCNEKYGVKIKKFWVKPGCVDLELFSKKNIKSDRLIKELNLENKIICAYVGKFGGIYWEIEIFQFFIECKKHWKEKFEVIIVSGEDESKVKEMARQVGFPLSSIHHFYLGHKEVPDYLGLADFALSPVKPVPSKRFCTPVKNGEYWALGLPVVIPANISDDSDIIEKYDIGAVLDELNETAYLKAIKKIDTILLTHTKDELFNKIRAVAEKYRNFEVADKIYKEIYS